MIVLLLFAFGLTCATVLIHAVATWEAIVHLARVWPQRKGTQGLLATEIQIVRVVSVLLLLHLFEAGIWAGFYRVSGILPELETAMYFSITSYTTAGYGDVVLPAPWRLLGPIEAAVGILMFGWSTAIIVAVITRIQGNRLPRGTEASGESLPP
jgi:voltage-gated potassium channel Kch